MFHLVFNGQISVDTKATKRQQRDAIKRLKRCNKERLKGKDNYDKNMMSSKVLYRKYCSHIIFIHTETQTMNFDIFRFRFRKKKPPELEQSYPWTESTHQNEIRLRKNRKVQK
jgi:hypothetical protein